MKKLPRLTSAGEQFIEVAAAAQRAEWIPDVLAYVAENGTFNDPADRVLQGKLGMPGPS